MLRLLAISIVAALASAFYVAADGTYAIADDYAVRFDTRAAAGTFTGLKGDIIFDPSALDAARIDVSVDVATISTGNTTKDGHAKGEAWFDAAAHPTVAFESTAVAKTPDGYTATGQLTLRGVTKDVTLPFTFEESPTGGTFRGALTVARHDYGIEGSFGQALVGDDVEIELVVPVRG